MVIKKTTKPAATKTKESTAPKATAAATTKPSTVKPLAPKTESKPVSVKKVAQPKSVKKNAPLAHGVGRRKSSVARVWLRPGSGNIVVNERAFEVYFDTAENRLTATAPIRVYPQMAHYDISVDVQGSGPCAQADAVKLAIARAMVKLDEATKPIFKKAGLLTVDSRLKERKKPGQKGARRKFQFVKR
ncbi:MAG: 30S ribosomal protein S9 [candidate division TM6 bacterium GW2011_GWF2_32_72]|nr:MAG: 30S ribosomal protein S9 [candidate division TM6 bacterium GW2011_GWF2_32_72]